MKKGFSRRRFAQSVLTGATLLPAALSARAPGNQWSATGMKLGVSHQRPEMLTDASLESILWDVIRKLHQKQIVLDFTDHLSDRELYCLIYSDILPAREKKLDHMKHYLHWDCTGPSGDPDVWLRYYASEEEREEWADCYGQPLPEREVPPYPRILSPETGQE